MKDNDRKYLFIHSSRRVSNWTWVCGGIKPQTNGAFK